MKVYIVVDGEYSDYHICEVFDDKILAEKYCALNNKDYWDNYRVEEYEIRTEENIKFNDEEYGYAVSVLLFDDNSKEKIVEKKLSYKIPTDVDFFSNRKRVTFYVNKKATKNQIIKIAHDEYAKYCTREI